MTSFKIDNSKKYYNIFYKTLPISGKQLILSKLFSSLIFTFSGFVVSILTLFATTKSFNTALLSQLAIAFEIIVLFLLIQMPIMIYTGNEILSSLTSVLTATFVYLIFCVFSGHISIQNNIQDLTLWLNAHHVSNLHILSCLFGILLVFIPIIIHLSLFAYIKKEVQ